MPHAVLISLHAAAGVVAFGTGCAAVLSRRWFDEYVWSLTAMTVFLAAAIALDWSGLGAGTRALYVALLALAAYMVRRGYDGWTRRSEPDAGAQRRVVADVGFTLVALFDGFVIILTLDLGAPAWVVVVVAIAGIVVGHHAVRHVQHRVVTAH